MTKVNEGLSFYLADTLGTVYDVADASGVITGGARYKSFGSITSQTGASDRYTFTGREFDSETGLYYYRARYFDPNLGRFISQDPLGFDAGDANLYRYVGNSPGNGRDPSGTLLEGAILNFRLSGPVLAAATAAPVATSFLAIGAAIGIAVADKDDPNIQIIALPDGTIEKIYRKVVDAHNEAFARVRENTQCPPVPRRKVEVHRVPPSVPHYPCPGDHWHCVIVDQGPPPECRRSTRRVFGGCLDQGAPGPTNCDNFDPKRDAPNKNKPMDLRE